jgi:hypothetical protein
MNSAKLKTKLKSTSPIAVTGLRNLRALAAVLLTSMALAGCNGGAETTANPNLGGSATGASVGGIPQSDLVVRFRQEMWPNLSAQCGACHVQGAQSPEFARTDDINLAYNHAITVTNLNSPADSRLVSKVGGGHNCWLPNNSECADVMTRWIENWVGTGTGGGRTIVLNEPTDPARTPGASRTFPTNQNDTTPSFETTVYPLLDDNCSGCHQSNPDNTGQLPIAPFFASDNVDTAYEAAQPKMDLDIPSNSRLVRRMNEGHNCFDADPGANGDICAESATALETAIALFAGGIPLEIPVIGNDTTTSGAVDLSDCANGTSGCNTADGGNRYENNQIALYEFKAGSGALLTDVSGAGTPVTLTLNGNEGSDYRWVGGYGIEFMTDIANAADLDGNSQRLKESIVTSGEYSIEGWVIPGNVNDEDRNIISMSGGSSERNFTLGQTMYNYDFLQYSSTTNLDGTPAMSTPDADEVLQSALQHVVATYDPINGRRIYVNGAVTNAVDPSAPGSLNDWTNITSALILGNEFGNGSPWRGTLRLAAIHDRALTHEQIVQNFEVGVGEKYYLIFGISHIDPSIIPPGSYIRFEFSQIDDYGYQFLEPTYINLVDPATAPNFIIQGLRIGVNGKLPTVGQAYGNLDVTLGSNYTPEEGETLSPLGTIIAAEKGIDQDEFFLAFDAIASQTNAYQEPPVSAPTPVDPDPVADIGIRTFAEINASMSAMTGVPITNGAVEGVYDTYEQQLPTVENVDGFLGSHQMAVAQLALTYCNELLENRGSVTRESYFSGFNFNEIANNAFNPTGRQAIIDPLLVAAMNADIGGSRDLTSQPDEQVMRDMLGATGQQDLDAALSGDSYDSLISHMLNQCNRNDPDKPYIGSACNTSTRTMEIVKATCAAAVGAAVMLVQ